MLQVWKYQTWQPGNLPAQTVNMFPDTLLNRLAPAISSCIQRGKSVKLSGHCARHVFIGASILSAALSGCGTEATGSALVTDAERIEQTLQASNTSSEPSIATAYASGSAIRVAAGNGINTTQANTPTAELAEGSSQPNPLAVQVAVTGTTSASESTSASPVDTQASAALGDELDYQKIEPLKQTAESVDPAVEPGQTSILIAAGSIAQAESIQDEVAPAETTQLNTVQLETTQTGAVQIIEILTDGAHNEDAQSNAAQTEYTQSQTAPSVDTQAVTTQEEATPSDTEHTQELQPDLTPDEVTQPDPVQPEETLTNATQAEAAQAGPAQLESAQSDIEPSMSENSVPEGSSGGTEQTSVDTATTHSVPNSGTAPPDHHFQSHSVSIGNRPGDVVKILDSLPVSTSQLMVQQSPIDIQDGYVYTANIEPGANGDVNGTDLYTVVRQGIQNDNGSWNWSSTIVEDRTVHDQWHTAPSVVADKNGYVHVAYNMHNFPWQYKRSRQPHDLSAFEFRGQPISKAEIDRSKFENKTTFPTLGLADIPGNQITYPAFYKDRNRNIYVSYRFAAKPKRSFPERTMSAGIAAYDTQLKSWSAIGGRIAVNAGADFTVSSGAPDAPIALASQTGWTVYHPRLMFGPANELHVNWFFRKGIAGAELVRPCYLKTQNLQSFVDADNHAVSLPMTPDHCGNLGYPDNQEFHSIGNSAMDSHGNPSIVLSPIGAARQIVSYNSNTKKWTREESPHGATEIFFDGDDNLWAIARGIRIMVRLNGAGDWNTVYTDQKGNSCYPKVSLNETSGTAFVHTHACDLKSVTVYAVRLN